ncbi:hypothetical protein ACIQ8G_35740 [Streptomyces sp. NPDC094154]|uniref:hypothetical protein n=1 Tax=Streptomyces sp. NPDC094154 TaxID=3366059 RepID=UPI0038179097
MVDIVAGKTKHSVRSVKVPRSLDPECCPVTAWLSWREQLVAVDARFANPSGLAFHSIDRWGNVGGPMSPDAVTQAVALTPTATRSRLGDAAGPLHHQGVSGAHVRGRRC